jgi:hypothetical protein
MVYKGLLYNNEIQHKIVAGLIYYGCILQLQYNDDKLILTMLSVLSYCQVMDASMAPAYLNSLATKFKE